MKATFEVEGIELLVSYDYFPAEPKTYDEPGCDASVGIIDACLLGTEIDIIPLLSEGTINILVDNVIALHEDSGDE